MKRVSQWFGGFDVKKACGSLALTLLFSLPSAALLAQKVVINEVLANHNLVSSTGEFVPPKDLRGKTAEMIEIYNAGDVEIALGAGSRADSYALSDWYEFVQSPFAPHGAWRFPSGRATLMPGESVIVFCDGDIVEGECELHASFSIAADGSEPITLWGPEDAQGNRPIVDQVWLPPLRSNVSFGRFPDGAGPAPVPVEETLDHFVYNVTGSSSEPTFQVGEGEGQIGGCVADDIETTQCVIGAQGENRKCTGAPNGEGVFAQKPRISRDSHSTNEPKVGEPVSFALRVRDDDDPIPGNITKVQIRYRVDGGDEQVIDANFEEDTPLQPVLTDFDPVVTTQPLDRYSLWTATIPAQEAGALVEFYLYVEDRHEMWDTFPGKICSLQYPDQEAPICADCVDGCDREFGGVNCVRDVDDIACPTDPANPGGGACSNGGARDVIGKRYLSCDAWLSYVTGFTPKPEHAGLVVSEVLPSQNGLFEDPSEDDCGCEPTLDCLDPDDPACCRKREDLVEIYNGSDSEVSLEGLGLTDSNFSPKDWLFPEGATIGPNERILVWLDNDGGKCPDPRAANPPCYWECPDPTSIEAGVYHTDFALNLQGDQIFIVDSTQNYGIVQGARWTSGQLLQNQTLALIPEGDPNGCYFVREGDAITLGAPNGDLGPEEQCADDAPVFRRGDASDSCGVDLSDAVFVLNWLFLGGSAPSCQDAADANDSGGVDLSDAVAILNYLFLGGATPADPGPNVSGPDPTDDDLDLCVASPCDV